MSDEGKAPPEELKARQERLDCFRAGAKIESLRNDIDRTLRGLERQTTDYSEGGFAKMSWEILTEQSEALFAAGTDAGQACTIPGTEFHNSLVGISQGVANRDMAETRRGVDFLTENIAGLVKHGDHLIDG
jgi:hypothetical protein